MLRNEIHQKYPASIHKFPLSFQDLSRDETEWPIIRQRFGPFFQRYVFTGNTDVKLNDGRMVVVYSAGQIKDSYVESSAKRALHIAIVSDGMMYNVEYVSVNQLSKALAKVQKSIGGSPVWDLSNIVEEEEEFWESHDALTLRPLPHANTVAFKIKRFVKKRSFIEWGLIALITAAAGFGVRRRLRRMRAERR